MVTDKNACTNSSTATLTNPAAISLTLTPSTLLCFGNTNGSISSTPVGGTPAYTYNWSNGEITATAINLNAGTYTLTVKDSKGCSTSSTASLVNPPVIVPNASSTPPSCSNSNDGTASAAPTGGTPGYTYSWSTGSTAATITGLSPAAYIVKVTDANACTKSATVNIVAPSAVVPTAKGFSVLCFGASTGSASVTATVGGSAPYSYSWSSGANAITATTLAAGTYTVTVSDKNACTGTATANVTQPAQALSVTATASAIGCAGGTGSVNALGSGGTAGYTYSWSTGATAATVSNLSAGTYTVVVTDKNACTNSSTATLTNPSAISVALTATPTSCPAPANSGSSITSNVAGGTPAYTYSWSNNLTTANINNIVAGTYTLTVKDSKGCFSTSSAAVTSPAALSTGAASTPITCAGSNNGTASSSPSGGTSPYLYSWSNGPSAATITGLSAGNYSVTVTDGHACTSSAFVLISAPGAITVNAAEVDVTCNPGPSNGSVTALPAGGTSPYTYSWSNGVTTQSQTNLAAASYTVTVNDAHACNATQSVTVKIPAPMVLTSSSTHTSCALCNGTASVLAAGGNGTYTYSWSSGASGASASSLCAQTYTVTVTDHKGCSSTSTAAVTYPYTVTAAVTTVNIACSGSCTGQATATGAGSVSNHYSYTWSNGGTSSLISALCASTYSVTATDRFGCTGTNTATITTPAVLHANASATNVTCPGKSDGTASIAASGGTTPYTYSWSNGAVAATITSLSPASYTVTLTDANACTATSSVTITQPTPILDNAVITGTGCHSASASISLTPSGGAAPYTYSWSTGATAASVTGLAAGSYSVTIADGGACPAPFSYLISSVGGPVLAKSRVATTCHGQCTGSASVSASGGAPAYTYSWSTGATAATITALCANSYTISVTDHAGCLTVDSIGIKEPNILTPNATLTAVTCNGSKNGAIALAPTGGTLPYTYSWSSGSTASSSTGLAAGSYTVTLTDKNSCDTIVNAVISQPVALLVSATATNALCNGLDGSAIASASGGTPNYTYVWSNAAAGATASNLPAGIYTVTATDSKACAATATATITQPGSIVIAMSSTPVVCFGAGNGSVTANPTGGTLPYTYNWFLNPGSSTASTVTSLAAGGYTLTITDANGCTGIDSTHITQPTAISLAITSTDPACGQSNGSIGSTPTGGTSPYAYSWSNGAITAAINNQGAGTYTLTVTDSKSCTATTTVSLTQAGGVSANITPTNPTCKVPLGNAFVLPAGGTSPYTYSWSNGATSSTSAGLIAGTYSVTVTDKNACTASSSATLVAPSSISIAVAASNPSCGVANGSIIASANGGTPVYSYSWSTGAIIDSLHNIAAGNYTVTVTDASSCTASSVVAINNNSGPTGYNLTNYVAIVCSGTCTGQVSMNAIGGTAPYNYSWTDNGLKDSARISMCVGNYTCAITDKNGCIFNAPITLSAPAAIALSPAVSNASCSGKCDGSVSMSVTGGTAPYSYTWSNGSTAATINNLCAATYTLTVSDATACAPVTATVSVAPGKTITPTVTFTANNCFGTCTATATASAAGGTEPYTYSWTGGSTQPNLSNMCNGAYIVSITDASGCKSSDTVTITGPSALVLNTTVTNASCGICNGSISTIASGGTPGYTYAWSTGATAASANGLCANSYTLTLTDSKGCTNSFTVPVSNTSGPSASTVTTTPASCFGNSDGTATVTPRGGTAPYTYSWIGSGATGQTETGLAAGTFIVQIADANGCKKFDTATVASPAAIILNALTNSPTCGSANGQVKITSAGGTPAYSYSWNTGALTSTIAALAAGSYTVTVTDSKSCTSSSVVLLNSIGGPLLSTSVVSATCSSTCNGIASVTITSGSGPFSIKWSNNATTDTITNLCAGTYTCTVTDANLCTNQAVVTIGAPAALAESTTSTQPSCTGVCNGSIAIAANGGTKPYTYLWSNGASSPSLNALCAGTYSLTLTDANSCAINPVISLNPSPTPFTITPTVTKATCGQCNGQIAVQVAGGNAPYQYLWSTASTNDTIQNLCAAVYDLQITDANGCTASQSIPLSNAGGPTASGKTITNLTCNASCNGSAVLNPQGGTKPYTYHWSNGGTINRISSACAGTYTVQVTDAQGCDLLDTVNITQPAALVANQSVTQPSACGASDGSIGLSPTGGTIPYTYSWSSGSTSATLSNLASGSYTVTITDAVACTSSAAIAVNSTNGPNISSLTNTPTSCNGNVACNGTATVVAAGGTPPYTYLWNDNNATTTATVTNLCAGSYIAQVTDNAGCVITGTTNITQPLALFLNAAAVTDATCGASSNGSATVTAGGGTLPYTYSWSTGSTSNAINNLSVGNYSVTVTDGNNCTASEVVTIVPSPTPFTITPTVTKATCGQCNGQIAVQVAGGNAPYQYLWSTASTNDTIQNLCAAVYDLQITDANGCTASQSIPLSNAGGPTASGKTITNLTCNASCNGSAVLNPQGGTKPYTYHWSNGGTINRISSACAGTYTVQVTDAQGCDLLDTVNITQPAALVANQSVTQPSACGASDGSIGLSPTGGTIPYTYSWSSGSTSATLSNLASGSYTVTITDAVACTSSAAIAVNSTNGPNISSLTNTPTSCNGNVACNGTATVVAAGGTPPYTYLWNDNNATTTATVTNLCAGSYIAQVTDNAGCVITGTTNITQPLALFLNAAAVTDATCGASSNGSATVTAGGGTLPYTYSWSTGSTSNAINNLSVGNYSVTVTDGNNCTASEVVTIVPSPTPFTVTPTVTKATCGQCNGQIAVQVAGGSAPYQYLWSTTSTNDTIQNLCAAVYDLQITDANGCTASQSIPLSNLTGPASSGKVVTNIACNGTCNGAATLSPVGGTGTYTYTWSNGATTATISSLCAGSYTVEISDAQGCNLIDTINISQPAAFATNSSVTSPTLCKTANGSIILDVTGGTVPYTYSWSGGNPADSALNNLSAGSYAVTITDAHLCAQTQVFLLNNLNGPTIDSVVAKSLHCFGDTNGLANAYVHGGTGAYTYSWSNSLTNATPTDSNLTVGNFHLQVTDNAGCVTGTAFQVQQPTLITVGFPEETEITCFGGSTGQITINATGGTLPYNYSWSNGGTSQSINNLKAQTYILTITDGNACTVTTSVTLHDPAPLTIAKSIVQPSCVNSRNGSIQLSVSGGRRNYHYTWLSNNVGSPTDSVELNLPAANYTVQVTDSNKCTVIDTIPLLTLNPVTISANAGNDTVVCSGSVIKLNGSKTQGSAVLTYQWYNQTANTLVGDSAVLHIKSAAVGLQNYYLVAANNGCADTARVAVIVKAEPTISLASSDTILIGGTLTLGNVPLTNVTGATYRWSPGSSLSDSTTANPIARPNAITVYTVTVTDQNGCTATATTRLTVDALLKVDNGVTPNGDGKNDVMYISGIDRYPEAIVEIYNRWGELIYTSPAGYTVPWNGKYNNKEDLPVGTYYYIIRLYYGDPSKVVTGPVTIIR